MPDRQIAIEAFDEASLAEALRATFSPARSSSRQSSTPWPTRAGERGADPAAPLIRYIEERRRNQARFTDPIERHPSPLTIIWARTTHRSAGHGPTTRRTRPDATLELLSASATIRWSRRPSASSPFLDQAFAPAG